MASTTLTVRVDSKIKKRLEKLAESTGRSRSYLATQAIAEYLDVSAWHIAGIRRAIASLERGGGIPHQQVNHWVESWGSENERPPPRLRVE